MVYRKVRRYDAATLRYRRPNRLSFLGQRLSNEVGGSATSVTSLEAAQRVAQEEDYPNPNSNEQEGEIKKTGSLRSLVIKWQSRRQSFAEDNPRSLEVFQQAAFYLSVFYLTHVWSTSNRIVQQLNNGKSSFGLTLAHSWFDPWQGFLNYFVYQRPRYLRIRKQYPELSRIGAAIRSLRFSYLPPPEESKTHPHTDREGVPPIPEENSDAEEGEEERTDVPQWLDVEKKEVDTTKDGEIEEHQAQRHNGEVELQMPEDASDTVVSKEEPEKEAIKRQEAEAVAEGDKEDVKIQTISHDIEGELQAPENATDAAEAEDAQEDKITK